MTAKRKQGVSTEQARADLDVIAQRLAAEYPDNGASARRCHVSRAPERRAHPHRVYPDAGRRGFRTAHCLRQRRQHDAEPRARPRAGDVGPGRHGRLAMADDPATVGGVCAAQSHRRSGRSDHGAFRRARFRRRNRRCRQAHVDPVRDGLHGFRLFRGGVPRQCGALRAHARAASVPRRPERHAQGRFARFRGQTRRHPLGGVGGVSVHACGRSACRSRPVRARTAEPARRPRWSTRG